MTAPTPDLPDTTADVAEPAPTPEPVAQQAVEAAEPHEEDLGLFAPTWYVLLCALPFAAAFLVPIVLIYQQQNAVPPVTAAAAAWTGVAAGWLLWGVGLVGWLLGKVVLSTPRARAPRSWAWWDRITRAWLLVVLAWGIVASLAVVLVGFMIDRLAA